MSFSDFLKSFFPHRWLEKDKPGNLRLFTGLDTTLDLFEAMVNKVKQESRILTAFDSIPIREAEYGIPINPLLSIESRRGNILARKQERSGPITKDDLIQAIKSAYGIDISIEHDYNNYIMYIQIENTLGIPDCLEQMQAYIESVCRAHIEKKFKIKGYGQRKYGSFTYSASEFL
jgi:hypothetical protein